MRVRAQRRSAPTPPGLTAQTSELRAREPAYLRGLACPGGAERMRPPSRRSARAIVSCWREPAREGAPHTHRGARALTPALRARADLADARQALAARARGERRKRAPRRG